MVTVPVATALDWKASVPKLVVVTTSGVLVVTDPLPVASGLTLPMLFVPEGSDPVMVTLPPLEPPDAIWLARVRMLALKFAVERLEVISGNCDIMILVGYLFNK